MKQKLCFLLLLCPFLGWCGQDQNIKIGDRVPDVMVGSVLNYGAGSLRLSDLRGKVVVLDFWATSCGSCIQNLPRLDSLQRVFGDRVAILAVTYEKAAVVRAFLGHNPVGKALRLPVITDDVVLAGLFPHKVISHEVWIDQRGVVAAVTDPEYVDARNIGALLAGERVDLPVKFDFTGFDYHKPMFAAGQEFYSAVGPYKDGVLQRVDEERGSAGGKTRLYVINSSILQLYLLSLYQPGNLPASHMEIRVRDRARLFVPAGVYQDAWNRRNSFCYESVLPDGLSLPERKAFLRADLDKFFGLKGDTVTKMVRCLSLQRLPGARALPVSRDSMPVNTVHSKDAVKLLKLEPLSALAWELDNLPGGLRVIDETGMSYPVDLQLPVTDLRDTVLLNDALRPYGLAVREVKRLLPVFVLRDALD